MKSRVQMRGDSDVKTIFSREKSDKDSDFENYRYGSVSGTVHIPHITVMNKLLKSSIKTIVLSVTEKWVHFCHIYG